MLVSSSPDPNNVEPGLGRVYGSPLARRPARSQRGVRRSTRAWPRRAQLLARVLVWHVACRAAGLVLGQLQLFADAGPSLPKQVQGGSGVEVGELKGSETFVIQEWEPVTHKLLLRLHVHTPFQLDSGGAMAHIVCATYLLARMCHFLGQDSYGVWSS